MAYEMQLKNYWQFGNINMNLSGEYVQLFTPVKQLGLKYQLWLGTNEIFLNYTSVKITPILQR